MRQRVKADPVPAIEPDFYFARDTGLDVLPPADWDCRLDEMDVEEAEETEGPVRSEPPPRRQPPPPPAEDDSAVEMDGHGRRPAGAAEGVASAGGWRAAGRDSPASSKRASGLRVPEGWSFVVGDCAFDGIAALGQGDPGV